MCKTLKRSFWRPGGTDRWELVAGLELDILAILTKKAGFWFGQVLPYTINHLSPKTSLYAAMQAVESYIKERDALAQPRRF